jgi:hypothetical protein
MLPNAKSVVDVVRAKYRDHAGKKIRTYFSNRDDTPKCSWGDNRARSSLFFGIGLYGNWNCSVGIVD